LAAIFDIRILIPIALTEPAIIETGKMLYYDYICMTGGCMNILSFPNLARLLPRRVSLLSYSSYGFMDLAKTACKNPLQFPTFLASYYILVYSLLRFNGCVEDCMRNHLRVVQDLFLASISPLCYFTIMWAHRGRREKFLSGMFTLEAVELILTNFTIFSNSDLYV
jgi:hypothetical protein